MIGSLFTAAQPALKIQSLQVASALPPFGGQEASIATLVAQPGGLIGWLQGVFGTVKTSTLSVTNQRVLRMDQSKYARDSVMMPISQVATLHNGSKTPAVGQLIVGAILALVGIPTVFLSLVGIALIASYFAGESYYVIYTGVGGMAISLKVKTKDAAQLDRLCSMSWETVKALDRRGSPALPPH